jgi:hypothetical protein
MESMTDLLSRPIRGVSPSPVSRQQPLVATAVLAAAATAVGGIVVFVAVAVLGWFTADTGSFAGAVRVGVMGWLFGNGSGLVVPTATITALPLGLLVALGWLLHRAGRWVARRVTLSDLRQVGVATVSMSAGYVAVALAAYLITRSGTGHGIAWRSLLLPLLLAGLAGGSGAVRESRLVGPLLSYLPEEARAALVGGSAGLAVMIGASAVAFSGSLMVHFSHAVKLAEGLNSGVVGGIVLALVGLAFAPNAIVCAGAYLAGPGFAVGTGTVVSPGRVDLGPLPAHPLLAALPQTSGAWWQSALLVVPLVSGAVAGLIAVRRHPISGYGRISLRGGLAGLSAGVGFGAMTVLATGSIGPGRMQDVGPNVLATLGMCAVSALVGGVVTAAASGCLGTSATPVDDSLS